MFRNKHATSTNKKPSSIAAASGKESGASKPIMRKTVASGSGTSKSVASSSQVTEKKRSSSTGGKITPEYKIISKELPKSDRDSEPIAARTRQRDRLAMVPPVVLKRIDNEDSLPLSDRVDKSKRLANDIQKILGRNAARRSKLLMKPPINQALEEGSVTPTVSEITSGARRSILSSEDAEGVNTEDSKGPPIPDPRTSALRQQDTVSDADSLTASRGSEAEVLSEFVQGEKEVSVNEDTDITMDTILAFVSLKSSDFTQTAANIDKDINEVNQTLKNQLESVQRLKDLDLMVFPENEELEWEDDGLIALDQLRFPSQAARPVVEIENKAPLDILKDAVADQGEVSPVTQKGEVVIQSTSTRTPESNRLINMKDAMSKELQQRTQQLLHDIMNETGFVEFTLSPGYTEEIFRQPERAISETPEVQFNPVIRSTSLTPQRAVQDSHLNQLNQIPEEGGGSNSNSSSNGDVMH